MSPRRTASSTPRLLFFAGLATAVLLLAAWIPALLDREAVLAPVPEGRTFLFSDTGASGRTTIVPLHSGKAPACVVRFASGAPRPFAGMGFVLTPPGHSNGIDISNADSIAIEYRHVGTGTLVLFVNTMHSGDSNVVRLEAPLPSRMPTWHGAEGQCPDGAFIYPPTKEWSSATLHRSTFRIPDWWREHHRLADDERLDGPEEAVSIGIQVRGTPTPFPDTIEIRSIRASFPKRPPLWSILAALLPVLVVSGVAVTRSYSAGRVAPGPVPLAVPDRSVLEADALLAWLSANYQRELDLESTARAVGIHPRRIAPILKAATGRTFPAQVNHLRITEARRLLVESDRQVAEIAAAVGFADAKYFQRAFKAATGATPGEWRDRSRKTA